MATNTGRKPSSPLGDALKLFFRNKPAVFAAIAIGILAIAAITGEFFTGKPPTQQEAELITENRAIGDRSDVRRNPWALVDPLDTVLEDKLLPPFSRSESTGKRYLLGTDHMGRDVAARLWAGASISLTVGFLAVGIMAILGIALGGIAGFWGRQRIQLPFFAMLILALVGGIVWGADFRGLAWLFFGLSIAAFTFQLFVVALGKRWRQLIIFGAVFAVFLGINGYNWHIESSDPNGVARKQAQRTHSLARETLLATRDFGRDVGRIEDGSPGAPSAEWRLAGQHQVEISFKRLELEVARFTVVERKSEIALLERRAKEREARARHLASLGRADRAGSEERLKEEEAKRVVELGKGLPDLEKAVASIEGQLEELLILSVPTSSKSDEAEKFKTELVRLRGGDQTQNHVKVPLQGSADLLDRRATLRTQVLDRFAAEAKNRFSDGIIGARLLNNHWRYPVYRITRHFITATILWLAMLVVVLMIAGVAQGAIQDIKGPLQKLFLPTMTVDDLVMRFTEIMIAIPTLFLILAVLAMFERDVYIVMAVIGLTGWMGMTRFVRAEILSLREQDFIQAARSLGVSDYRIIWRHLVPNAISPVLVAATIGVATAVLAESTLSFLGIGAAPDQPTWGQILNDGRAYMTDAWWLMVIPGIAILITVLSFNLLGEGLREAFNPKLRGR